jgi:hypothetical protein
VLAVAFILTRILRSPARESNLDTRAFHVDTTGIDRITLTPSAERTKIVFTKNGNTWKVSRGQVMYNADPGRIRLLLSGLSSLIPERIVSRKTGKWNEYQVGDTTGTTVIAFSHGKEIAHFTIGKESADATFARKNSDKEVYAISGNIAASFNRKFNDWRDHSLLRVNADDVRKIRFTYPADSSFVLSKKEKLWMVNDTAADSVKTRSYLDKLRLKEVSNFADDFSPTTSPDVTLTIEADSSIAIKGWRASFSNWILTSNLQPGVYFSDEGNVVARDLFAARRQFIKE